MTNVSGTGLYTTVFNTTPAPVGGVIVNFGRVVHTLRVRVNGKQVPPLDVTRARSDVSKYVNLTPGPINTIEAEVATPLFNERRPDRWSVEDQWRHFIRPVTYNAFAGVWLDRVSDGRDVQSRTGSVYVRLNDKTVDKRRQRHYLLH